MPDNDAGHYFCGRTAQLQQLLELLRAARSGVPAVAVIRGRRGMGKTALVENFLELAEATGSLLLRAAGALWEKDVPLGLFQQLLAGKTTGRRVGGADLQKADLQSAGLPGADLADLQSADLETVLRQAREQGARDEPRAAGEALLGLIATLAADTDHPLLLWVDNAQWADAASLRALLYALRRVGPLPLMTILCVDPELGQALPGAQGLFDFPGATAIDVGPLTPTDVQELSLGFTGSTTTSGSELTTAAARILAEHTGGSPAMIRSLLDQYPASAWSPGQESLPAPAELIASARTILSELPAEAATLAEAAAVLGVRSAFATAAQLSQVLDPAAAVESAHSAGLLELHIDATENNLQFPVPVLRAAVYQTLGPARRALLHAAAAQYMTAPVQRLRHLAAAALLPDAALAAEFEATADGFASRGAWGPAADAYAQAARLNPQAREREALLIKDVDAMVGAGQLPRAEAALEALDAFAPSPRSDAVRGYLAILRGRPAQADALLQKAWTAVDPSTDPETAGGICQREVLHALARFNGRDLVMWADRARRIAPAGSPPAVEAQAIEGLGLGAMGRYSDAEASYHAADRLPERSAQHQRIAMGKGWLHLAMDRVEEARAELAVAVPTEFGHGSQRISLWAQAWLARADFALGAWDDALETTRNAVALQEETGLELLRPLLHWTGAQIHALRGDWEAAARHLERGSAASESYPTMLLPYCLAQAQVAETKADYDGVIRALLPVVRMQRSSGLDEPGFWPWQDHYANALVMVGRVEEAGEFLLPHEQLAAKRNHRSTLARLAYVRGRIQASAGNFDAARRTFQDGLAQLDPLPLPYARARIKFAYGQSFRRAGKRREAAEILAEARELFSVLGAEAYVDRCSRELRASGVGTAASPRKPKITTATGRPTDTDSLTEQEKAVAGLVASGLSNKDAAAELYVSVKTIQYHLTRIYSKLRITSRSELAALYAGEGANVAQRRGQAPAQ